MLHCKIWSLESRFPGVWGRPLPSPQHLPGMWQIRHSVSKRMQLAYYVDRCRRRRLGAIGDPPDDAASVVGDEQGSVGSQRQSGRPAPDLGPLSTRSPESRRKSFVVPDRAAVGEGHAHDHIADRIAAVPRAAQGDEGITRKVLGKHPAVVEYQSDRGGMAFEQQVRQDTGRHQVRAPVRESRLRVRAGIGVWPSVERTGANQ